MNIPVRKTQLESIINEYNAQEVDSELEIIYTHETNNSIYNRPF